MNTTKKFTMLMAFAVILMSASFASAETEFVSLGSMGDYEINEYVDFYVPNDFYLMDNDTKKQKYLTITDQPVVTNGKVDIVLQIDENKLKNKKSEVEAARNAIAKNLSAALPFVDIDTSVTIKVGKKYVSLIRITMSIEGRLEYTIVAIFEAKGQTMVMTYKINDDLLEPQETFFTILSKIKFK